MSAPFLEFRDVSPVARPMRVRSEGLYATTGKRVLDLALVLFMLPVVLPVLVLLTVLSAVDGGRPLYAQERVGRNGRTFLCWKFRTMVPDAEARLQRLLDSDPLLAREWAVNQKLACDPRITRLGAVLRRSSLDELPQLWNVVNGTMSLVGPRPFTPEQSGLYAGGSRDAAYYSLRPGLTGPWQVSRRSLGSFAERAAYDSDYARTISLGRDIGLIFRTALVVLKATGV
jgi:lipopolysaccharide/colanic/teichoic acid biosynthesis glycosyltransferase